MTEQPTSGYDETHRGYQPPPYRPPYGGDGHIPPRPTTAPHLGQSAGSHHTNGPDANGHDNYAQHDAYGQPAAPYADAYGQPYYYGVAPAPKGLSIASLCCGVAAFLGFGFFLLPQLAAVILGHLALQREPGGRGLAVAGLVLGYAAIAITLLVVITLGVALSNADFVSR